MEPIAVIMIAAFAAAFVITMVIYSAWERKYIKEHFAYEKETFIVRKQVLADGNKRKNREYLIEADVEGHPRDTYIVSKAIYDQLQEGKTYQVTFRYNHLISVKS